MKFLSKLLNAVLPYSVISRDPKGGKDWFIHRRGFSWLGRVQETAVARNVSFKSAGIIGIDFCTTVAVTSEPVETLPKDWTIPENAQTVRWVRHAGYFVDRDGERVYNVKELYLSGNATAFAVLSEASHKE